MISHNITISQETNSHIATMALLAPMAIMSSMVDSLREKKIKIADRQRLAIERIMRRYDLKVAPWCRLAGITEGALRNFLNASGKPGAMGSDNLELLANAIGITIAELLDSGHSGANATETDRIIAGINSSFQKLGTRIANIEKTVGNLSEKTRKSKPSEAG